MKRTKKESSKPLYRKITRGTLHLRDKDNHRIKPKQEIRATPEELGKWIDEFELIRNADGSLPKGGKKKGEKKKEKKKEAPAKIFDTYTVEHIEEGWYNVLSSSGNVMNESKLREADAKDLKAQLEEETTGT